MVTFVRRFPLVSFLCCLLAFLISFVSSAGAQGLPHSSSQPRVSTAIDESSLVTLPGNTHPLAQARFDRGPAPASMAASRLLLVLARSQQQEAYLQTYLQSLQDADSPNYRKFLTPDEFGRAFGVGDSDLETIQTWLRSHGFTVNKVSKSRMAIEFSGTAGQVQSAFHTSLHSYQIDGERFWANNSDPQIPTAMAPVVAGLVSLNSFKPKAQNVRGPSGVYNAETHTITPTYTTGSNTSVYDIFLGPADAATIYDTPTTLNPNLSGSAYDGTGVTIGILGDSNIDTTQNDNYRSTFGLPAKATTVVVDGNDPGENDDAVEAYLDTEVAEGIAPNANVILYTSAGTNVDAGLNLAITRALDDNQADILNLSFLGCESQQGTAGNLYILDSWEQAAAQGIPVTVASGDSGSAGCDDQNAEYVANQGFAVNGYASTPYNIAMGGTDFDILLSNFPSSFTQYVNVSNTLPNHRSALSYIPEEPWNNSTVVNTTIADNEPLSVSTGNAKSDNIVGSGGGISILYPVPSWQTGFATGSGRNLPDVSLLAGNGSYGALWGICTDLDPNGPDCTAGATGNSFNLQGVGGTSAAAPAFAGMLALVEQKTGSRLGQADNVLYDLAESKYSTVFHDITTGNNSVDCAAGSANCSTDNLGYLFMTGYNAATGYDLATGLGSVDASALLSNWASTGLAVSTALLQLNGATSALNITHGQSVNVAATVSGSSGTPTGVVALVDSLSPASPSNSEGIADFTLTSGSATGTTNLLPGGSYQVSAHYGGSSTYAESDSNTISVTVAPESSTTVITSVTAYDPATGNQSSTPYYGFNYAIYAQPYGNSASAANPDGPATGSVTFKSGSITVGTAALASNGIAELQTATIPGGTTSLIAAYPGDASFNASTSAPYSLAIVPAVTTVTIPNAAYGVTNTISVTVALAVDSAGAAPTGTVAIMNGSNTLGTVPMIGTAGTSATGASGSASFTSAASLPPGTYNLTGVYSGDINYAGSTTPVTQLTLPKISTGTITPTVKVTGPAATANYPITVTVTVSGPSGDPTPTGSVTLTTPTGVISQLLTNGSAAITFTSGLNPGPNQMQANYLGDSNYAAASGATTVNVFEPVNFTFTPLQPSIVVNQPLTMTVGVAGQPSLGTATGTITLSSGSYTSSATQLTAGSASFTIPANSLAVGNDNLTASYSGDSNYLAGSVTEIVTVTAVSVPGIAITGSAITLAPGTTTGNTSTITITPSGGFTGIVTLNCGITPASQDAPTCTLPLTVSITGTTAQTATLTVNTTAPTTSLSRNRPIFWPPVGGAALALVLLFCIPGHRHKWQATLGMLALLVVITGGVVACGSSVSSNVGSGGGGGNSGTPAGSYTINVTGTSGSVITTSSINLTVQ